MDPKALSHLDPKARETYDRIMGTAAQTADPADPLSAQNQGIPPTDTAAPSDSTTYNSDLGQIVPTSQSTTPSEPSSLSGMEGASPSIFSTPAPSDIQTPPDTTSNDIPSSPNSSFFINPSPAASDISAPIEQPSAFAPVEPPQDPLTQTSDPLSPVTPYQPESAAPVTASAEPFAEPLPSPADVNQQIATHETSPLLKVLYIVGAVIFFAIYTIFWIKVFNLPFLF